MMPDWEELMATLMHGTPEPGTLLLGTLSPCVKAMEK